MLVEMVVLAARKRQTPATVVLAFLPGVLILLALRAALTGAGWSVVAAWLAASFPAHLADLRRRGL
ncbi:MAG: hypothetical protein JO290_06325 [Sphingomonadaceae bacterium]|nr:hypothetical protein [Sphingomonadaceae bacterium]